MDISMTRLPVQRPPGDARATFACPGCDVLLVDGPHYAWCPACTVDVDWVDLERPVWACPTCYVMHNDWDEPDGCDDCDGPIRLVSWPPDSDAAGAETDCNSGESRWLELVLWMFVVGVFGLLAFAVMGTAIALFDPALKPLLLALAGPFLLIPIVVSAAQLWFVLVGLGGIVQLVRNRTVRIIHGLEHATIRVLEEQLDLDDTALGGIAHFDGFELRANTDAALNCQDRVKEAATEAIRRVRAGETDLTLSPRCGTSLLVAALIQSVWVTTLGFGLFLTTASATTMLAVIAPIVAISVLFQRRLGLLAQRYLTVSSDFESARVISVVRQSRADGRGVSFGVSIAVELEPAERPVGLQPASTVPIPPGVSERPQFVSRT